MLQPHQRIALGLTPLDDVPEEAVQNDEEGEDEHEDEDQSRFVDFMQARVLGLIVYVAHVG